MDVQETGAAKLDEKAARRTDFCGGYTLKLADGQEWVFARPLRLWAMDDCEDGVISSWNVGDKWEELRAAVLASYTENSLKAVVKAEMEAYKFLLLRNYRLLPADFARLLRVDFEHDDTPEGKLRTNLMEILLGNAPSPTYKAWARYTLQINGADRPGDTEEDVVVKAEWLRHLGRTVDPNKWIVELRGQLEGDAMAGIAGPA